MLDSRAARDYRWIMRSAAPLFAVLVACASSPPPSSPKPTPVASTAAAAPPAPRAPRAPIALEQYFKIARVAPDASISADERWVAFATDLGGRMDIWVAPTEGGAPRQLTHVDGFIGAFQFAPKGDHLAYLADQGGNELNRLYLTTSAGAAPVEVTQGDPATARADWVSWIEGGKSLLYKSTRRDPQCFDLYQYDLASGRSKLVWKSDGKLDVALASRDGKRVILSQTLSDVDSQLFLYEAGMKAPVLLTPHSGDVLYAPTSFSANGKTLYFTSDEKGEFTDLYAMDLATRKVTPVLSAGWDVEDAQTSDGGRYFYTSVNADGLSQIVMTELATQKVVPVPGATADRAVVPLAFSPSDRFLAAAILTDGEPRNVVVIDLEKNTSHPIVEVLPESLRGRAMVTSKLVRIPALDGREVPAFLYLPSGPGPFPAEIEIHGGPTAQSSRAYSAWTQYLVSKGVAVLVPNVRGSTGYGKAYTKLDNLDLGGGPLDDVVACKRWLIQNAPVDPERVFVLGGSYGGYMALAAAAFRPTEFALNVDYFGVSDLKSLVESFPPYWAAYSSFIYAKFGDPKNPAHAAYQRDRSPLNALDKVERPLLVVQGENDPRVKKDQSDRVVEKLKGRGVAVHYLVIPGEGHGFSTNEHRLSAYRFTDRFLDRYLFGDTSVQVDETPAP